jgi:membrane-associated phospholipid phosphatase
VVSELTGPAPVSTRDVGSALRAFGVTIVAGLAVGLLYAVFVRTGQGQRWDQAALRHLGWSTASRRTISTVLDVITIGGMAIVLTGCVLVALARRRWAFAAAAVVLVGVANLATQELKHQILPRPELGYGHLNSLPSGHTTVTASITMAALLVVPRGARWWVAVLGAVSVAVTGVGTVVAGWHRPADVAAALCVTLAVATLVMAVLSLGRGTEPGAPPAHRTLAVLVALPFAAAVLLALGVRPDGTAKDLVIHLLVMGALATFTAAVIALYTRMVDVRFG